MRHVIRKGIMVGIISHSMSSGMILKRAEMMGIEKCYIGDAPKREVVNKWCKELDLSLEEIAYVGDDINDMDIIEAVGLTACPADSVSQVINACDIVLKKNGGDGCVREFLDMFFLG